MDFPFVGSLFTSLVQTVHFQTDDSALTFLNFLKNRAMQNTAGDHHFILSVDFEYSYASFLSSSTSRTQRFRLVSVSVSLFFLIS